MSRQAEARKQNRTVVRGEEKPSDVVIDYVNQPRSSNGKNSRGQTPDTKKTQPKASAFGVVVKPTNGDFVQPNMLPVTIATKSYITSQSVAARNTTQTKYMK